MRKKLIQMHRLKPRQALSFLMLCAVPLSALNLQVLPKVGSSTSFSLTNVQRLTFAADNLIVTKKDASTSSFPMTSMGYLNFTDVATASEPLHLKSVVKTYPNPVQELLQIEVQLINNQPARLEIVNLDGKVVIRKQLDNPITSISIAGLPKGMYLCRVQNGKETSTAKFIKQ